MFQLARDLFILMDSAIICIYFRNSHSPNFFNNSNCCLHNEGYPGCYTNKFTETGL